MKQAVLEKLVSKVRNMPGYIGGLTADYYTLDNVNHKGKGCKENDCVSHEPEWRAVRVDALKRTTKPKAVTYESECTAPLKKRVLDETYRARKANYVRFEVEEPKKLPFHVKLPEKSTIDLSHITFGFEDDADVLLNPNLKIVHLSYDRGTLDIERLIAHLGKYDFTPVSESDFVGV